MKLLDTHQHLFYREHLNYLWSDQLPALAGQNFTVADFQQLTQDKDVAATLFMEVDAEDYHRETRLIADLAADPAHRIAGLIASCRPETDAGFDDWLAECDGLSVVGYRRILHEVPDDVSQSSTFRANVRKIGTRNRVFDMVFRNDQLALARDLAAACDNTQLVLDHCGVPDIAGGRMDPWRQDIAALAALPHVYGKISGVLAYCAEGNATEAAVKPYIAHMIACFGPDRLLWGSDWPVVNLRSSLPQWIDIFRATIADLSADEQAAICHGTAQRVYGVHI